MFFCWLCGTVRAQLFAVEVRRTYDLGHGTAYRPTFRLSSIKPHLPRLPESSINHSLRLNGRNRKTSTLVAPTRRPNSATAARPGLTG